MNGENPQEHFSISPERFDFLKNDAGNLLGTFSEDAEKIGETSDLLISKYSEPHRAYHNLNHVSDLLGNASTFESQIADHESLRLAIWFHDAIYDPQSKTNEIESAALAVEKLSALNYPKEKIERVETMILATQKHDASGLGADAETFLDLDLAILGADAETYEKYARAIRLEYSFVPEALYREKRREILEAFLRREFIYYTEEWRENNEEAARMNIANEIKELS